MVKLLSPVASLEAAVRVISAGADEVYCAVKIPDIIYPGLSMRHIICSVPTYDELGGIVKYAHSHGVKTIVTMELPYISEAIEEKIKKHICRCSDEGVDALIAGDLGIILTIKKMNLDLPIYASTYITSMNYEAVDFLRSIGVTRVMLERHLTVEEITEIVKHSKGVELEVFIHGSGCSNLNGNCYGCYTPEEVYNVLKSPWKDSYKNYIQMLSPTKARILLSPMCRVTFEVYEVHGNERRKITYAPILDAYTFCSLCQLPNLVKTGVTGFKIVGREMSPEFQEVTTRIYRELIDLIESGQTELFHQKLKSINYGEIAPEIFEKVPEACFQKRCYYHNLFHSPYRMAVPPEIWVGRSSV